MATVKVPAENHARFEAALPKDARIETLKLFGGVVAKVNGHVFAGLFGRSVMVLLSESDRVAALALEGAAFFDPMGDGKVLSKKVMLPEGVVAKPVELRRWIARAFENARELPAKAPKTKGAVQPGGRARHSAGKA